MHACYSLGAALGPIAMSVAIIQLQSWRYGYLIVSAAAMGTMMLIFIATRSRWAADESAKQAAIDLQNASMEMPDQQASIAITTRTALTNPLVWFHIVAFFLTQVSKLWSANGVLRG